MSGMLHDVRPRPGCLPTGARSAIIGLLLIVGVLSTVSEAVQDFTCYNQQLYVGNESKNTIGGYKSGSDTGAVVSLERALDTGGGTDLPSGSGPKRHKHGTDVATIFTVNSGQTNRFGAYNCKFDPVDDQPEVQITTLIMAEDAYITPESPTVVAVVGEPVTLTMLYPGSNQTGLRWKHNGNDRADWNGEPAGIITTVQATDAGIYECFEATRRAEQKHGIMKLIVRECGLYSWNPQSCSMCPACHNGGVCDDKTGDCICAPGFSGDFCETLIGKNYFGQDAGLVCISSDPVTACVKHLMCLPDPFGCTCAASFTGTNCENDCPDGYFGAGCRQQCHCANGVSCNKGHGRCPGECEDGFRGENCQNNCPIGQIGRIGVNCIECTVPVAVKNPTITSASNQQTITWEKASNMCPVSNYTVQFELINRDQCQPVSDTYRDVATTEALSYVLQEPILDSSMFFPYSSYKIRVRARNEAGLGLYLNDVTNDEFITAEQASSAPPANVMHLNVTNIGAIFQWDEVPCGSRKGLIAEYTYELTKSNGTTVSEGTTERSKIFNDLISCSDYTFRVAAKTSIDVGVYSNESFLSTNTKAHLPVESLNSNGGLDMLLVTWDAPDVTQNPCHLHYIVQYELTHRDQCEPISSPVRSEGVNRTTPGIILDGLDAYSTYTVYVWTWNEAGLSEERSISSTTSSKAPDKSPAEFELVDKTKNSITVSWSAVPCGGRNGEIVGYWMRYKILDKPYNKTFDPSLEDYIGKKISDLESNVTGLEPSTQYDFQVAGLVQIANEDVVGPYATTQIYTAVETDIEKPKNPTVDTSLTTSSTVTIALSPPAITTYVTDFQIGVLLITPSLVNTEGNRQRRDVSPDLYVAGEFSKDSLPDTFTVGDDQMYGGYHNKPLKSSATYEIYIGAVSKTSSEESTIAWGDPIKIEVGSGDPEVSFPVAAIIIPILIIIVVGVAAGGLFLKRRGHQEKDADSEGLQLGEIKEGKQSNPYAHSARDNFAPTDEGVVMATASITCPSSPEKPKPRKRTFRAPTAVPLTEFEDFIHKKKAQTYKEGNGFLWDYKNLPDEVLYPFTVAKEEKNKTKNRYANIIPYDDTRVVLEELPDDPNPSDYVNASYIDGFNAPKHYIATQGPNKASVPDMWRMVWQENCTKIVMLTNLVEGIKGKCEQYWPDKTLSYGKITVKLVKEVKHVDYIIRDFITLGHEAEEQQNRKVRQYHFTTWPDMGLPQDPSKVVDLVKIVKEYRPNDRAPMVVHCSAGVGRTGTFIILDAMLDQAKAEGKVDIWNFAHGMRDRRMKMIQTSAQYEFVFDALLDEFQCGDKTIKSEELRSKLTTLKKIKMPSRKTGIQLEFESLEKVASCSSSSDQCRGGREPDNIDKNRFPDIVPVDRLRPRLMTAGEAGSTDYINASFLNSYSVKSGYITTQMPMPQTVGDLWRMAYDYNATCIVMLNSENDQTFANYLPTWDEPTKVGPLSITLESTDQLENSITMRSLILTNHKMEEFRKIRQLQLTDWPDVSGVPATPKSVLQVVTAVHQWQKDHGNEDRIIVHCIDGVRASGTFCALLNIMAKLNDGNVVDVYRAVMKIKGTRAGMVPSLEHYSFLYGAVKSHLDTDIVYENL